MEKHTASELSVFSLSLGDFTVFQRIKQNSANYAWLGQGYKSKPEPYPQPGTLDMVSDTGNGHMESTRRVADISS